MPGEESWGELLARKPPGESVAVDHLRASLKERLLGRCGEAVTIGRYRVGERLGAGGGGSVLRAFDPELDRAVAIKLVHTEDVEAAAREARAMARLNHRNVVTVHDVGTATLAQRDVLYIVMELVAGPNLARWLDGDPPLDARLRILADAARGLAALHRAGIVHRDFKPSNVLVGRDDESRPVGRVCDFGLAVTAPARGDAARAGTPRYMAPEQLSGGETTERTDQYAFCVVALSVLGEGRQDPLRRGLQRGTDPEPKNRHASMGDVVALFDAALSPRRRRWTIGAATSLVAVVVGAGALGHPEDPRCDRRAPTGWDPTVRAEVESRDRSGGRLVASVDAWAEEFGRTWAQACRRHAVEELDAEELSAVRECLEYAEFRLTAVTQLLAELDDELAVPAPNAVAALDPPSACFDADYRAATSSALPPHIVKGLAQIAAAGSFGRGRQARSQCEALREAAVAAGDDRIAARVGFECAGLVRHIDADLMVDELHDALAAAERVGDETTAQLILAALGRALAADLGRPEEGRRFLDLAQARAERSDTGDMTRGRIAFFRAVVQSAESDYAGALRSWNEAYERFRRFLPEGSPWVLAALAGIGSAYHDLGRLDEARDTLERALTTTRDRFGSRHPNVAASLDRLGRVALDQHQTGDALARFEEAVAIRTDLFGPEHRGTLRSEMNIARALSAIGRHDEALARARAALEHATRLLGADHPQTLRFRTYLAQVLLGADLAPEAETVLRPALDALKEKLGDEHILTAEAAWRLATARAALGDAEEAHALFAAAVGPYARALGEEHYLVANLRREATRLDEGGR